ncbi:cortexin domain-containing 1 isoform X1 [Sapajus apella]|uniref:Cortexin domain-containing 1 isoform X1 n=1 Tax=Sapajus apella TaxID=9515 RepID=A0A6J3GPJ6_SAPAP|nr:cortexin domain-containing 1 isoform X1 [Sapajus apella]
MHLQSVLEEPNWSARPQGALGPPPRAANALPRGLKFLSAFPLEQRPAASPLKCQGGRGSAQSPPRLPSRARPRRRGADSAAARPLPRSLGSAPRAPRARAPETGTPQPAIRGRPGLGAGPARTPGAPRTGLASHTPAPPPASTKPALSERPLLSLGDPHDA